MNTTDKNMALADKYAFYAPGSALADAAREALRAEIEALVRERDELKKQNKLYAGMLVYGSEVVFPRGDETTEEEAIAAIDAKSAELNNAAIQEKQS